MKGANEDEKPRYGCSDYREEMRLMGLKRRLEQADLPADERENLEKEIAVLEKTMGLD